MFVFSPSLSILSIFTKCFYIFFLLVPLLLLFLGLFLVSEFSPGYTILARFLRLFLHMWRIGMTNYFRFICIWIFSFTCSSFLLSGSFPLRGSQSYGSFEMWHLFLLPSNTAAFCLGCIPSCCGLGVFAAQQFGWIWSSSYIICFSQRSYHLLCLFCMVEL